MSIDLAAAGRAWAVEHPAFIAAVTTLETHGIQAAVFSSAMHHIVCRAALLPSLRPAGDIDLLVSSDQFDDAARLLGSKVHLKQVAFQTRDELSASFIAREIVAHLGPDDVHLVDPVTPLSIGTHEYDTSYTSHAASARTIITTDAGILPLAHLTDTIGMYAIIQRSGAKNDAHNAATLLRAYDPIGEQYTEIRSRDMGWDTRVWKFIQTVQPSVAAMDSPTTPDPQLISI